MKIVILAAGSGTRMGTLTEVVPKSLIDFCGKSILSHIFDVLEDVIEITEIILVVNSEKIILFEDFIKSYGKLTKNITIVSQIPQMKGTYAALLSVKNLLKENEEFLVANGDDIHLLQTYNDVLQSNFLAMAIQKIPTKQGYYDVVYDEDNFLLGFSKIQEKTKTMYLGTGLYKLDHSFFSVEPVEIFGGEFGIPQTLLKFNESFNFSKVKIIKTFNSLFLNTPDDLKKTDCSFLEKVQKPGENKEY